MENKWRVTFYMDIPMEDWTDIPAIDELKTLQTHENFLLHLIDNIQRESDSAIESEAKYLKQKLKDVGSKINMLCRQVSPIIRIFHMTQKSMEDFKNYTDLMNVYENYFGNTMDVDILDNTLKQCYEDMHYGLKQGREYRMTIENYNNK